MLPLAECQLLSPTSLRNCAQVIFTFVYSMNQQLVFTALKVRMFTVIQPTLPYNSSSRQSLFSV